MTEECDRLLERAAQAAALGPQSSTVEAEAVVVLGRARAFRPNAVPVGVWLQRALEMALREGDLWCDGATLAIDFEYGGDWDEEAGGNIWPTQSSFVLWGRSSALLSGTAEVTFAESAPPPPGYFDDDAYLRPKALEWQIVDVGDHSALPSDTHEFLDEEVESETAGSWWAPGCIIPLLIVAAVAVLTVIGLVVTLRWAIELLG